MAEDIRRTSGAGLKRGVDVSFADAVAVADVHGFGGRSDLVIMR